MLFANILHVFFCGFLILTKIKWHSKWERSWSFVASLLCISKSKPKKVHNAISMVTKNAFRYILNIIQFRSSQPHNHIFVVKFVAFGFYLNEMFYLLLTFLKIIPHTSFKRRIERKVLIKKWDGLYCRSEVKVLWLINKN